MNRPYHRSEISIILVIRRKMDSTVATYNMGWKSGLRITSYYNNHVLLPRSLKVQFDYFLPYRVT